MSQVRFKEDYSFHPWSGCADPTNVLSPGCLYDVERIEVHSWHTRIFLKDDIDRPEHYYGSSAFDDEDGAVEAAIAASLAEESRA